MIQPKQNNHNMERRHIIFYGSLPTSNSIGGGEVGNARTIRMLERNCYSVTIIRHLKPSMGWSRLIILFSYPFRLIAEWLIFIVRLSFNKRNSLVHISGFAGKYTLFNEYILIHLAKLLGYNVLYELRGGAVSNTWETGGRLSRAQFSSNVNCAIAIFSQGKENINLIQSLTKNPVFHYPNCVEESFAPRFCPQKQTGVWNILYYGRLEEYKNIEIIVNAVCIVQKTVGNLTLTLVGDGYHSYVEKIRLMLTEKLQPNSFSLFPACKHSELKNLLADKHFFIFPSAQPFEGQSNALTESMSFGIVPIASPQGFNRSTIGNDALIVESYTADEYAAKIIEIIQSGMYSELSSSIFERYFSHYSQSVVEKNLIGFYDTVWGLIK